MRYNSLREYFYKFHNLLYAISLIPLLAFVVLYWQIQEGNLHGIFYLEEVINQVLLFSLGFVVLADWVITFFLFNKGLRSARKLPGLGIKLDRYYNLTLLRFTIVLSGSLTFAIGFYLTENQVFTILAVLNFFLLLLLWPSPAKVCGDLQLKGDERTLVRFKKDKLH